MVNARARSQVSAASLVDTSLRRSTSTWGDLDASEELTHLTEQVWEDLLSLADPKVGNGDAALARLDKHREEYRVFYRHAEHVAQSTTLAATRPLKQKVSSESQKVLSESPSASSEPAAVPPPSSLNRARRLIPAEVRRLIPLRLKRSLAELFG